MRHHRLLAVFALVLAAVGARPATADSRVALIIGNGAYLNVPHLPNPRHDAEDVDSALKRTGFTTIVGLDLDQAGMQDAAIRFARAARTADVALFYYSGHAMQYAGVNYLIPIDARIRDEADLRRTTRVDEILADLQQARNLRILVLDSCRDNPLADELRRSVGLTRSANIGRGLAKMASPDGSIISYATQAGRTAEDGNGRNSPYTSAFLKHIEDRQDVTTVFHRISAAVYQTTRGVQVPELSLSFFGEFYLNGKAQVTVQGSAAADPCLAASDHWKSAESIGTMPAYEDHLARFPACAFASLAKTRIDGLKNKVAAVAPQATVAPSSVTTLQTGLIGYWPLDGENINWASSSLQDTSGNANTGTMVRMSALNSQAGKIGGALKFDGRTSYLSASNRNFPAAAAARSISVWIKTSQRVRANTFPTIVAYGAVGTIGQYYGLNLCPPANGGCNSAPAGAAEVSVWGGLPVIRASITTRHRVNDGNWHHLVSTFDGTSHRLYLDGVLQGTAALTTHTVLNTNLYIGGPAQHVTTFFDGLIDEVRIYNRALSDQEVALLNSMAN